MDTVIFCCWTALFLFSEECRVLIAVFASQAVAVPGPLGHALWATLSGARMQEK